MIGRVPLTELQAAAASSGVKAISQRACFMSFRRPVTGCWFRGHDHADSNNRCDLSLLGIPAGAKISNHVPILNIRRLPDGSYRLRVRQQQVSRLVSGTYATRKAADATLWAMATDGLADWETDQRYRALVLLTAFA